MQEAEEGEGFTSGQLENAAKPAPLAGPPARRVRPPNLEEAISYLFVPGPYLLLFLWTPGIIFALAEPAALLFIRKSIFVALTDGAFEREDPYGLVVEVHVWTSALMWFLAAFQILFPQQRRTPEGAVRHRWVGKAMLLLYLTVVLPTSLYLTMLQRVAYMSAWVGAVLLDTAFCTSYFLFRGWRVARCRINGGKSLTLHGGLMQCGILMSMAILPQRMLQLVLSSASRGTPQLNYSVSVLSTSLVMILYGHFSNGARAAMWIDFIGEENLEEALGSAEASALERWAWRLRWPLYVFIYCQTRSLLAA